MNISSSIGRIFPSRVAALPRREREAGFESLWLTGERKDTLEDARSYLKARRSMTNHEKRTAELIAVTQRPFTVDSGRPTRSAVRKVPTGTCPRHGRQLWGR